MAHILKSGKTYKDPFNGDISTTYINTKYLTIDINQGHIDAEFKAYNKKESRDNGSKPINQNVLRLAINDKMNTLIDQLVEEVYKASLLATTYEDGEDKPVMIAGALATDLESDEI